MNRKTDYTLDTAPPSNSACVKIFTAVRIADTFRDRIPTQRELMAQYGMDRSTAWRWVSAFKYARGVA